MATNDRSNWLTASVVTQPHRTRDAVPIGEPERVTPLDDVHDPIERRTAGRDVVEDHRPRVVAVVAFDLAVRALQPHPFGRQPVVLHERVLVDRLFDREALARAFDVGALVAAALHEDRERRGAVRPRRADADFIEVGAVRDRLGLEGLVRFEILPGEAEPGHHLQEELRMRLADGELPGLLLEDVLGERRAHPRRRPLPEDAREQHREVANVDLVLVPEVDKKLVFRETGAGERRPRPVVFSIHDREQPLLQGVCHRVDESCHASRFGR